MRLQRYMAKSGVASRRRSEEIIKEGRVKVNDIIHKEMGYIVKAEDIVKVDGKIIKPEKENIYIILNKPKGYITTLDDSFNRPSVIDLIKGIDERIFPIGRLDKDSSGLLLFTNDGKLANKLMHPKYEVKKTYRVLVKGIINKTTIKELEDGVYIGDRKTYPAELNIININKSKNNSLVDITIHEGRNRQVRRMFSRMGHSVLELERISQGEIELGNLKRGQWRYLTADEVKSLKE